MAFLAPGIEFLARLLPAAWAMDAVVHSLPSQGSVWQGFLDLAIALTISIGYLSLAYLLLVRVERRVRVEGNMRAFLGGLVTNFFVQSYLTYRALFFWLNWPAYTGNVFLVPVCQGRTKNVPLGQSKSVPPSASEYCLIRN